MTQKYEILRLDWTPNPNAFKLVLNEKVTAGAGLNFTAKSDASKYPLARDLAAIKDVDSVFLKDNFITLTQAPEGAMNEIHDAAVKIIQAADIIPESQLEAGGTDATGVNFSGDFDEKSAEEKLTIVNLLFDKEVRPGLAMDGGGLDVLGLEGNTLQIRYQGACGSCPSSTAGTLNFINQLLQSKLSPSLQVVNV